MKLKISKLDLWLILISNTVIVGTIYISSLKSFDGETQLQTERKGLSKGATIEGRFEQEFLMTRDPKTNTVPKERLIAAYEIARLLRLEKAGDALPIYWMERGPNNIGGRTRALLIDANDPSDRTVWAGGVSGGVWRTTNIDANPPTWTNIDDFFDNLAITSIVQDPTNNNIMYFGTGEGWGNFDAVRGLGIWRSLNGGQTWNILPSTANNINFRFIQKLLVDGAGRLFACTNQGVFRSTNNGNDWGAQPVIGNGVVTTARFASDIELAADGNLFVGFSNDQIYRSNNNGNSWQPLANGLPSQGYGRIELAVAPNNANFVYVIYQDTTNANENKCLGVFQSINGGNSFAARTCPGNFGAQAWYDLILAVDPNNENRLWAGGVGASVSNDGGNTWSEVDGGHADYHNFVFNPGSSTEVIIGNDGGVYKSYDGNITNPTSVDKNNSYNVTQFYAVAVGTNNNMIGGTQDNGTQRFNNPGLNNTDFAIGADGGWCHIDQDNNNIQIGSIQWGSFRASTNQGVNFTEIVPGQERKRRFITPSDYDDANNILYFSDTLGHLGRVSDIGNTNIPTSDSIIALDGELISALKVSPNQKHRLFVGTGGGVILRIDSAHLAGMTIVTPLTSPITMNNRYISSITVEDGDDNHLLLTFSQYGVNSIWESPDGGITWQSIEGNLPDMPIRWVEFNPFNPDQALIATELGVWSTPNLDGSNTKWYPTNFFGLANVRVDMLQFRESDYLLAAATHGRGIFTTDYFSLFGTCPPDDVITGNIPSGIYFVENTIESNGTVQSDDKVIFRAGEEILLTDGFTVAKGADFWAIILSCTPGNSLRNSLVLTKTSAGNPLSSFYFKFYPNPTVKDAIIEYSLEQNDVVSLEIRDIKGSIVANLIDNRVQMAGIHTVNFDASNLKSGFYLVTFRTKGKSITEKIIVARS